MSMLKTAIAMASLFGGLAQDMNETLHEEKIAELKQQWRDSMKLPRKKKKAERKRINKEYSFYMALYEDQKKNSLFMF